MFAHKYFHARYFAQRYFSATPAAEGSLSASASGHAIVAATLSAAGWAQAGLLGAGVVAAWISSGSGFIGAALFGSSSLSAYLSAVGESAQKSIVSLSWGRARTTTYTSFWDAPPPSGFVSARLRGSARLKADLRARPKIDRKRIIERNNAFLLLAS